MVNGEIATGGVPMSVEDNKAVVMRILEAISAKDLDAITELYHEDVVYHGGAGEELTGRAAVREIMGGYVVAFPDLKVEVEDVFGEGDRVFARFRLEGTNTGELMGLPVTGKHVELRWVMYAARLADGKVAEEWEILDRMDLLAQLGHLRDEG